ncbi:hypothetical protein Ciccas_014305, partial [Cichlidogyrus casuarinus]
IARNQITQGEERRQCVAPMGEVSITEREVDEVIAYMVDGPAQFRTWKEVQRDFNFRWNAETMQKRAEARGFIKKKCAEKFELNESQALTRYAWCLSNLAEHPNLGFWTSCWFLDELAFKVQTFDRYRQTLSHLESNQHQRPFLRLEEHGRIWLRT